MWTQEALGDGESFEAVFEALGGIRVCPFVDCFDWLVQLIPLQLGLQLIVWNYCGWNGIVLFDFRYLYIDNQIDVHIRAARMNPRNFWSSLPLKETIEMLGGMILLFCQWHLFDSRQTCKKWSYFLFPSPTWPLFWGSGRRGCQELAGRGLGWV